MNTYEKVKQIAGGKISIAALEAEAGIANGTISGWKTGKPYAETLYKVATVLGCTVEDLLPD